MTRAALALQCSAAYQEHSEPRMSFRRVLSASLALERASAASRLVLPRHWTWFVACDVRSVPFTARCAYCLAPTNNGRRESGRHHPSGVVVPYCSECLSRLGRQGVLTLAWCLASALLGLVAIAFIPMLAWIPKALAVTLAAALAFLPWIVHLIWRVFRSQHSLTLNRAVVVFEDGLGCSNEIWARQLAEQFGTVPTQRRVYASSAANWSYGGVVVAVLLSPWLYDAFHPQLRLLNLSEDSLVISADDHVLAKLEPTSTENPRAGSLIRVASGRRALAARRTDGTLVEAITVDLLVGHTHLFAPSRPQNVCFWLEQVRLGRSSDGRSIRELLTGSENFWALPAEIDSWFGPVPGSVSRYGTGGLVTSLRQGACPRADE